MNNSERRTVKTWGKAFACTLDYEFPLTLVLLAVEVRKALEGLQAASCPRT